MIPRPAAGGAWCASENMVRGPSNRLGAAKAGSELLSNYHEAGLGPKGLRQGVG